MPQFNLIQLPNLRWIPKTLSSSPSPSSTQLERDTEQGDVRFFILIRPHTVLLIITNRKMFNWNPLRVFETLSQSFYLSVTSLTTERHTIAIFMIYAFKNASSKSTPSTKSMGKLRSRNTFHVVLSSPLQHTHILKVDLLKCSSHFTLRFSHG